MDQNRTKNQDWLPVAGLVVLTLIWGYNWVVMKTALAYCGPFSFAAIRAAIGSALLFLVAGVSGRALSPGSFGGVLLLGLFQTTGFFAFSIWALVAGGAGKTVVLVYTMPFWLLILARPLLGERLHRVQWTAAGLAFAGLIFLFHPWKSHPQLASTVLACMAGLSWALAGVWNKYLRSRVQVDLIALNAWQLMLGTIPLVGIALLAEAQPIRWSPYLLAAIAYNAVLATAVAWSFWFFALQQMPAGIAGLGTLITPVLGVVAAWLQLGEVPGSWERIGMLLVFCGLAILSAAGLLLARRSGNKRGAN